MLKVDRKKLLQQLCRNKYFSLFRLMLILGFSLSSGTALAAISFLPSVNYTAGTGITSMALGDFDGDGKLDIVVTSSPNFVSVLRNNGNGTFATKVDYTVGSGPQSVAVGDFNGDGKLDLAVTNADNNTVSILRNNGNGTFAAKVDYLVETGLRMLVSADFNGDGKLDLAMVRVTSDVVSVLRNNGDGTFATKADYATGSYPLKIAVGDFNGDGKPDLAATNYNADTVSILHNNGNGTFAARNDYATGPLPWAIAVGDMDGNGKPDLVVASGSAAKSLSVLRNNGSAFAAKVDYFTGKTPYDVALSDLDGDGKLDLVVTNAGNNSVSVLRNNGDGTFASNIDFTISGTPLYATLGDLNGDGVPDLVTAGSGQISVSLSPPPPVPGTPSGISTSAGNGLATITFNPASGIVSGYLASCSAGGTTLTASGTASPLTVNGLTNGTTYQCSVAASNVSGTGTTSSTASVTPFTTPGAPTALSATMGDGQTSISFSPPTSNGGSAITGYTASCNDGGATHSASGSASPLGISGLTNGTIYQCSVVATNIAGSGTASSTISVTPFTIPGAPTALSATVGNSQTTISFSPPASTGGSTITGYTASCSGGGTTHGASGSASPLTVDGLTNGTNYQCSVIANNSGGASVASSPVSVTPVTVPGSPTALSAIAGSGQATISFSVPDSGGSAIISYAMSCSGNGSTLSVTGGASPLVINGLTNGTTYQCTVIASNAIGVGAASTPVSVMPFSIPDAPTNLTAIPGNGQATISFSPPAVGGNAITGYSATCMGGGELFPPRATSSGSPLIVNGLNNNTTYVCLVTANSPLGAGAAAVPVLVTPRNNTVLPTMAGTSSGSTNNFTLTGNFTPGSLLGAPGSVFIAVDVNGWLFLMNNQGKFIPFGGYSSIPTYSTGALAELAIPVIKNLNISGIPLGTTVYLGYGLGENASSAFFDMLENSTVQTIYTAK